jgi:hypothetical protein
MTFLERIRRIASIPWVVIRQLRILRAWNRENWPRMVSLLRSKTERGLDTTGTRVLLGVALGRQGRFPEALWHFEQVNQDDLYRWEEPVFFTEYAHVLARAGKLGEAQQLLRNASRDRWPESHRRWADEFLVSASAKSAPPLGDVKPRTLH